jgi:hypothetical protein
MGDSEIAPFSDSKLETILEALFDTTPFEIDVDTKAKCLEIAQKYNKKSGALAVNALSVIGYAAGKDRKTFDEMVEKLENYDFPTPKTGKVPEDCKYMHPELRADIMRKSQGITQEDQNFFQDLYDRLGVKPQK